MSLQRPPQGIRPCALLGRVSRLGPRNPGLRLFLSNLGWHWCCTKGGMSFGEITPFHPTVFCSIGARQRRSTPPSRAVLRSMHAGQWFQDSLILRCLPHLFDWLRRAPWELFRHGLTGDSNSQLHDVLLCPCQENLFLINPACFLPLLRHMIFMLVLLVCTMSMLWDPHLASELTTAVRAW